MPEYNDRDSDIFTDHLIPALWVFVPDLSDVRGPFHKEVWYHLDLVVIARGTNICLDDISGHAEIISHGVAVSCLQPQPARRRVVPG